MVTTLAKNGMHTLPINKNMILANIMAIRIANTRSPCCCISCGPGRSPCAMNAPTRITVKLSPGMPSVNSGTKVGPLTALFAASAAATPSSSPLPNFSGVLEALLAAA